jgi:hypothetical protein
MKTKKNWEKPSVMSLSVKKITAGGKNSSTTEVGQKKIS